MGKTTKSKTICFDIDGTICTQTYGEYERAKPILKARKVVNRLHKEGFRIIFFTARYMGRNGGDIKASEKQGYAMTLNQLKRWGFKFHKLFFGKPSHHILVDDKAVFFNRDWDEIYHAIRKKDKENIY